MFHSFSYLYFQGQPCAHVIAAHNTQHRKPSIHGRHYRGKVPGHVSQAVEAAPILYTYHDSNRRRVCFVFRFRNQPSPNLGRLIGCQSAEGFLPVPEGRTFDGQFQAPGLHDYPCPHESGAAILAPDGQPISKAHNL